MCKRLGGGGCHIEVMGVIVIVFRSKSHGLVPLKVLKSKMTSVRGAVAPFKVLSQKYERK